MHITTLQFLHGPYPQHPSTNFIEPFTLQKIISTNQNKYFSYSDGKHIWVFDAYKLFTFSKNKHKIINPFTRRNLSKNDTQRLVCLLNYMDTKSTSPPSTLSLDFMKNALDKILKQNSQLGFKLCNWDNIPYSLYLTIYITLHSNADHFFALESLDAAILHSKQSNIFPVQYVFIYELYNVYISNHPRRIEYVLQFRDSIEKHMIFQK